MVDNRSAGFYGIGGAFNFKSGDISGTAAKSGSDKQSGEEYFAQQQRQKEEEENKPFVDRSAQLRASLNSLAAMNSANIRFRKVLLKDADAKKKKKVSTKRVLAIEESDAERH